MEFLNWNVTGMDRINNLLGLRYLSKEQIEQLLDKSDHFRKMIDRNDTPKQPTKPSRILNLFFENSTRTRVSFELAAKMLGHSSVNFTGEGSSIAKGESLLDTVKNLEAMKFDIFIVRHEVPGVPKLISETVQGSVINAGDGAAEHPTQGLLDILTLKRSFGRIEGLRVCIVGDISHSRVAMSNIHGLTKLGAKVSVCAPRPFLPSAIEGLNVDVYEDIDDALKDHDALNLLRVQLERDAGRLLPSLREFNRFYGMTLERLSVNPKIRILHPGPMNINVELDSRIAESKNSLIFEQVTNGLAVRLAVISEFAERKVK